MIGGDDHADILDCCCCYCYISADSSDPGSGSLDGDSSAGHIDCDFLFPMASCSSTIVVVEQFLAGRNPPATQLPATPSFSVLAPSYLCLKEDVAELSC